MSEGGGEPGGAEGAQGGAAAAPADRVQHAHSFKLRFAAQREPGRSYVSLVRPRGLPATVTGKFYTRAGPADAEGEGRALARIRDLFELGPRDRLPAPLTESHRYGWWASTGAPTTRDPRLSHHIRDSAWLKARLLVLAADDKLKRK